MVEIMNHNINKLDLTITILFFFFLLLDKTFSIKRNSFWQYINNYNVICCACTILTSCSLLLPRRRPSQRGMYVPRMNFKSGHFEYLWKSRPCLCRYFTIVFVIFPVAVTVSTQIHVSVTISFVLQTVCHCFEVMSLVGIQP